MAEKVKRQEKKTPSPQRKRIRNILLIVLGVLIIIRLILPSVVLHFANKTLASMHGYYGHVEDIDIALIRGAYQLNNIFINKIETVTQKQTPFFRSEIILLFCKNSCL